MKEYLIFLKNAYFLPMIIISRLSSFCPLESPLNLIYIYKINIIVIKEDFFGLESSIIICSNLREFEHVIVRDYYETYLTK